MINRRRFLAISGAALAVPGMGRAQPIYTWKGMALGAQATLRLAHPDAKEICARAAAEISRLEDIFSLYRADSALSRLNQASALAEPPFELLECLSLASVVHAASGGRFDPTIQPLWACHAEAATNGVQARPHSLERARALIGWSDITFDTAAITMRPGMAITLNGIAQGFIADRVAAMLGAEGLTDILIDTGELRALGTQPDGAAWPVSLGAGGQVPLAARALATSAPLGTTFDAAETLGHILDPRTGMPAHSRWREISISAGQAALADALSTAACLYDSMSEIDDCVAQFRDAKLEAATPV
ncbi:MAG: FAD:protein FMN transferase [Gemmobacter sp.]|nr:FAD:protein FMN transferase [Gemmobacter sp.]